eukprot:IDg5355t1
MSTLICEFRSRSGCWSAQIRPPPKGGHRPQRNLGRNVSLYRNLRFQHLCWHI